MHTTTVSVGENKQGKRIWLEGKWLLQAGFTPGSGIDVEMKNGEMTITVAAMGKRKVSGKKNDTVSVIDINNADVAAAFRDATVLRVVAGDKVLRVSQTRIASLIRSRELCPTEGSVFTGGGFLSHAAKLAGFEPIFGVEINSDYAAVAKANHPNMHMFNVSAEEVAAAELQACGKVGVLTMGVPCEPYSAIRRLDRGGQEKRDKSLPPEAHELGDMFFWGLRVVDAVNPHTVIMEEVPGFLNAAAGHVTLAVLRRLGYNVDARIINPLDYGEITGRKRAVIIATTGRPVVWPQAVDVQRTLKEFLDPEPHDWFDAGSKPWVFNHWAAQTAKGNGFAPPRLTGAATVVPTIKKRYFAGQGDNPVVAHPTDPGSCRWFTLPEVARIHGIPASYQLPEAKTTAGEIIGQGVLVSLFEKLIRRATAA